MASQPKRPRRQQGAAQSKEITMTKLLTAHESSLEKVKAALVVFLFVPQVINDAIEKAAKGWKDRNTPGQPRPDNCSCTTVRLKTLLDGINEALKASPPLLQTTPDAVQSLTRLTEVVKAGRSDLLVADITLRIAGSRTAAQSPYEITLTSSQEGLSLITQPGAPPANTKDNPVKSWELRAYRPARRGPLMQALHA